ncbi:MAG: hypothetical protein ACK5DY_02065 [Bacteroidota bacterium]|jgi:hypothetical protein
MNPFARLLLLLPLLLFVSLSSCRKTAGSGGNSKIQGRIKAIYYDVFNNAYPYYAGKEDVYIIYGDEEYFGDDVETSYDGTYEFPFLRKGKYTIFAYSDCDTCVGGLKPEFIQVDITENNSVIKLDDLIITKY